MQLDTTTEYSKTGKITTKKEQEAKK